MTNRISFITILAALSTLIGCQIAHQAPASADTKPATPARHAVEDTHFFFVQITDTHFGEDDHLGRVQKVVDTINNLPMDIAFVVHTGDIVDHGIDDQASLANGLRVLENLKVPVYFLPGNHDIFPNRLKPMTRVYNEEIGPLFTSVEHKGVTLILLFTEPLAQDFSMDGYEPLSQLENRLNQIGTKPVIICHHTPSVEDFYRNKMHRGWQADIRKRWVDLINSYDVKAVLAGHFHRDEQHWLGNVPLYVSPAVAGFWSRQATFRIYEYKNGKISYRTQYIK